MPGPEPELHGFARMIGNGVGDPSWLGNPWMMGGWNQQLHQKLIYIRWAILKPRDPMSLLLKAVVPCFLCAMALKRPHSSCAYEDELRELMTYQCPFTGENRCPPFKNESVPMIQSCTKVFWSDMTPLKLGLQHNWFIIYTQVGIYFIEDHLSIYSSCPWGYLILSA